MDINNIHPLFKLHNVFTKNVFDPTKECEIICYSVKGESRIEKNEILCKYFYKPILNENELEILYNEYFYTPLIKELYVRSCGLYEFTYTPCMMWYNDLNRVKDVFDINYQIEKYKQKKIDDYSAPIIKDLDLENLDNINIYRIFKEIILHSEKYNIKSVNMLLNGTEEIKLQHTFLGNQLSNSINNIVYKRFLTFLENEQYSINKIQNSSTGFPSRLFDNGNKKVKPVYLKDIFPTNENRVSEIQEAISKLGINKFSTERQITGFIDGCKDRYIFQKDANCSDLIVVIYKEIGKDLSKKPKPRYEGKNYTSYKEKTINYFSNKN